MNLLWITLFLIAILTLLHGFHDAIMDSGSWDMQWSPSKLLLSGVNPYKYWLEGNSDGLILLHQQPNYLHALYLIILPLTTLSWHTAKVAWALINTILGISVALYLGKKAGFTKRKRIIIVLLFLCSTSFQNTIASGQQSLFVLFFVTVSFYCLTNFTYIVSTALAIVKYSFAPPLIFYEYYKNGLKKILGIIIFTVISILLFSVIVKENPISIAAYPFVISKNTANGQADLMTLCNIFLPKTIPYISYILSLLYAWYFVHIYYKNHTHRWLMLDFAYLSLISLTAFKHLNYDFVFLLPLLVCASHFEKIHRIIIYSIIFWFWFAAKMLYEWMGNSPIWIYFIPIHFLLLLLCMGIVRNYAQHGAYCLYTKSNSLAAFTSSKRRTGKV